MQQNFLAHSMFGKYMKILHDEGYTPSTLTIGDGPKTQLVMSRHLTRGAVLWRVARAGSEAAASQQQKKHTMWQICSILLK